MNPALVPLAAAQGLRARRRIEELPEAAGDRVGLVDHPDADAPPLRIAVLGESTAAGCGAPTQDAAFVGSFSRLLADRARRAVHWRVGARNGSTIHQLRTDVLPNLVEKLDDELDVAVVMIGVNDVMRRTLPPYWRSELDALLDDVTSRAEQTVVTGVPPFHAFPSLPRTLARWLDEHGDRLDAIAAATCAARPTTTWVGADGLIPSGVPFFARDGFHPSPIGYRLWAEQVVAHVPVR